MAKLTLSSILTAFQSTTTLNTNFAAIVAELTNKVVYRDETSPMAQSLDMNSNTIVNLAAPTADADAARRVDVTNAALGSFSGDVTFGGKVVAGGDTAAGDTASMGYTATEGCIITGQGSVNDITIKNDADQIVASVLTGTRHLGMSAGNVTMPDGYGIDFSNVEGGGATSSILDDYEEGTWTCVVADDPTAGNVSATTGVATYIKIGNVVHCTVYMLNIDTTGLTGTNDLYFRGLPFTSANISADQYGTVGIANTSVTTPLVVAITNQSTRFRLGESGLASDMDYVLVNQVTDDAFDIFAQFTYTV